MTKLLLILLLAGSVRAQEFVPFFATQTTGNHLKVNLLAYWEMDTTSGGVPNATGVTSKNLVVPAGAVDPGTDPGGVIGIARNFDQTDVITPPPHHYPNGQYFACNDATAFNFGNTPFTIAVWVFFQNNRGGDKIPQKTILSKGDGVGTAPTGYSWLLAMNRGSSFGTGQFLFYASKDGSTLVSVAAPATASADIYESGHWWLVTVTWNGINIILRARDATSNTTTYATSLPFNGPFFTTNDPMTVACLRGTFQDLWGSVDGIGIWDRALDAVDLCELDKLFNQRFGNPAYAQFDLVPCIP